MTKLPATRFEHVAPADHGPRQSKVAGVVIHTIEGSAAGAKAWFSNPQAGGVGAHVIVGLKQTEQLVDLDHVCWHVKTRNHDLVGFEHDGSAGDSMARWLVKRTQRKMSANRAAWVCFHYGLGKPTRFVNVWGHVDVPGNDHTDPGPNFPWLLWMLAARRAYKNLVRSNGERWTR